MFVSCHFNNYRWNDLLSSVSFFGSLSSSRTITSELANPSALRKDAARFLL